MSINLKPAFVSVVSTNLWMIVVQLLGMPFSNHHGTVLNCEEFWEMASVELRIEHFEIAKTVIRLLVLPKTTASESVA